MTRVESILKRLGIEATKHGPEWVALCPNPSHDDHKPSWRIRDDPGGPREGFHKCWPCGFGGGLLHLVRTVLDLKYRDAQKWLESEELAAPPPAGVELAIRTRTAFRLPEGVELSPMSRWVTSARKFAEKRSITSSQVDKWGMGYAIEGRLEGRIVIPVRNKRGQLSGYTARTFVNHPKRYLEPEAFERANRGVLFGEQFWSKGPVIVLEGAIKALAVERVNPINLAVTSGSDLGATIALKLATFDEVIIATDNDPAGDKLAEQIGWVLDRQQVYNHRLQFPKGRDADQMDPTELNELIELSLCAMR